jgi:multidrug efflux pump subunit AcrA (membrane-fusion protein)
MYRPSRELGRVSAEALERIAQALREDVDRLAPFLRSIPADPAREGGVLAQLLALLNIGIVVRDATVSAALAPLASDASVSVQSAQQRIGNLLEAQTLAVIAGSAGFVPLETPLFLVGA